jgi:hypothetical protein
MPIHLTSGELNTVMQTIIDKFAKKTAALGVSFNTDFLGTIAAISTSGAGDAAQLAANLAVYDKALQTHSKSFEGAVAELTVDAMNQLADVQRKFYKENVPSMSPEEIDAFIGDTKSLALQVATMHYKGIADAGWQDALDAFKKTIISGGSKADAINALKDVLVPYGVSPLPQNISSATTDALNQFARMYNMTIMGAMGQEWFSYTGSLLETSRCFCISLEGRGFFHMSEIPLLLKGKYSTGPMKCTRTDEEGVEHTQTVKIYDRTGLPEGMIPGTTQQSFFIYAGGWNCGHQIFPVSTGIIPKEILDEVYASQGYKNFITRSQGPAQQAPPLLPVPPPVVPDKPKEPPKPDTKKKFVPGKTKEETAKNLQEHIIEWGGFKDIARVASHGDLDVIDFNIRAQILSNLFIDYEMEASVIQYSIPEVRFLGKEGNYYGAVSRYNRTDYYKMVFMDFGSTFDKTGRLEKGGWRLTTIGQKSRVDDDKVKEATITHEFAHVLSVKSHLNTLKPGDKKKEFWKKMDKLWAAYQKDLRKTRLKSETSQKNEDKKAYQDIHLGMYAGTNINEFMAEGFTEYRLRKKPGKYAKLIGELIDNTFKRK